MTRHVLEPESLPCNAGTALAYVSTQPRDRVKAPGLTLLVQMQACQRYARRSLHRCVSATFADRGALRTGFQGLVAHLTVCRQHLVVVHRIDRLPLSGIRALAKLGTRIVSATGERLPQRRAEFLADVARLARQRR